MQLHRDGQCWLQVLRAHQKQISTCFFPPLLNKHSISTRLAWQLTSSLEFSALFCLLVVKILLPALVFCLLQKITEREKIDTKFNNDKCLILKKTKIVQSSSAWDQVLMSLQEVRSEAPAMRTILPAGKAKICLLFCCIHFRVRRTSCVPQK